MKERIEGSTTGNSIQYCGILPKQHHITDSDITSCLLQSMARQPSSPRLPTLRRCLPPCPLETPTPGPRPPLRPRAPPRTSPRQVSRAAVGPQRFHFIRVQQEDRTGRSHIHPAENNDLDALCEHTQLCLYQTQPIIEANPFFFFFFCNQVFMSIHMYLYVYFGLHQIFVFVT